MKICLLAPANSIHTQKIAYSLVQKGYKITICTFHNANLPGIKVVYIPPVSPCLKKINYILNVPRTRRIIESIKPDILHAHYISSYGIVGYLTKFHPLVVSVWGSDIYEAPRNPLIKFFIKKTLRDADVILSTSKAMARQIQKFVHNKKIEITPFGINLFKFFPIKKEDDTEFIVGTARKLAAIYGIKYLIKAFAIFLEEAPHSKLLIAGDGPQKKELINIVKKLKIENKVIFLGFVSHDKLSKTIGQIDVFCIPSIREGFGVAALEAQACGIPVIGSDVGGLPETIINDKTGFLVKPKDPYAIAKKLLFLYRNPVVRKNMAQEARKFVAKYYDWTKNIEIIENQYKKLVPYKKIYAK